MNIEDTIEAIEQDVIYFTNINYPMLAEKFKRDLELVKYLNSVNSKNEGDNDNE